MSFVLLQFTYLLSLIVCIIFAQQSNAGSNNNLIYSNPLPKIANKLENVLSEENDSAFSNTRIPGKNIDTLNTVKNNKLLARNAQKFRENVLIGVVKFSDKMRKIINKELSYFVREMFSNMSTILYTDKYSFDMGDFLTAVLTDESQKLDNSQIRSNQYSNSDQYGGFSKYNSEENPISSNKLLRKFSHGEKSISDDKLITTEQNTTNRNTFSFTGANFQKFIFKNVFNFSNEMHKTVNIKLLNFVRELLSTTKNMFSTTEEVALRNFDLRDFVVALNSQEAIEYIWANPEKLLRLNYKCFVAKFKCPKT